MKSHLKYLRYVLRHKWYVWIECARFGLYWQGIIHDLSKFSPAEWSPYVNKFYGGPWDSYANRHGDIRFVYGDKYTQEWVDRRFDAAWLHHQHVNPHHWQHWVLREDDGGTKALEMPVKYAIEMVCDWTGAGRAIHGRREVGEWYGRNREKIILHPVTRALVEDTIATVDHNLLEHY